ncbi:MAG: haloacid dehalogenase [Anaerolineae bacterium]|nr:haloacid dehalogenase [Anaerolineae bacterium]
MTMTSSISSIVNLKEITDSLRTSFEARTQARDHALQQSRELTRLSAHTIRAIHREEFDDARANLAEMRQVVAALKEYLAPYPDLYFAGYTQDAVKEYVEAHITLALVLGEAFPTPAALGAEDAAYTKGMAEAATELRRRVLDILRRGYSDGAEVLLEHMDAIYTELVTFDYPDAVTYGLRRQTDLVRGVLERTRGDMTMSLRQHRLASAMHDLMRRLDLEEGGADLAFDPDAEDDQASAGSEN